MQKADAHKESRVVWVGMEYRFMPSIARLIQVLYKSYIYTCIHIHLEHRKTHTGLILVLHIYMHHTGLIQVLHIYMHHIHLEHRKTHTGG